MRRLIFEKTIKPGVFAARCGEHCALVVAHVCNGKAVYGFDELAPDQLIEQALLNRSAHQVARLIEGARELGS